MTVPMEAKPIMMSGPMVVALNARRKRQTRRTRGLEEVRADAKLIGLEARGRSYFAGFSDEQFVRSPYGGPGGQLWVREGVRHVNDSDQLTRRLEDEFDPLPLKRRHGSVAEYIADGAPAPVDHWGWKNKALPAIHMPRGLCRHVLQLTEVRVERLQEITEADAIAEGIVAAPSSTAPGGFLYSWPGSDGPGWTLAKLAYRAGWEWLNGPASWDRNPWIWVLCFDPVAC